MRPTSVTEQRIGIGYDIHRLIPGGGLRLAGHDIACALAIEAHSDGDVVLHALVDALLGARALGDIGEWFPDHDPAHRNRPSREFLDRVLATEALREWQIVNVDCNVIAQTPRLSHHKAAMRHSLSTLLGIDAARVGLKARSHEGLDAIGAGQAIAAQVVVLIENSSASLRQTRPA